MQLRGQASGLGKCLSEHLLLGLSAQGGREAGAKYGSLGLVKCFSVGLCVSV